MQRDSVQLQATLHKDRSTQSCRTTTCAVSGWTGLARSAIPTTNRESTNGEVAQHQDSIYAHTGTAILRKRPRDGGQAKVKTAVCSAFEDCAVAFNDDFFVDKRERIWSEPVVVNGLEFVSAAALEHHLKTNRIRLCESACQAAGLTVCDPQNG